MTDGHLDSVFPVSHISLVGVSRREVGDLGGLVESIQRLGLLTPVVVTGDGLLICGTRRVAAARRLGWATIPAWIPEKVSESLRLFAIHDDQTLRKPLTPIEQANLYAEYEALYAQQAVLRCEATRFQAGHAAGVHGGVESATPSAEAALVMSSRRKAALAVTGQAAYTRLEQIRDLQQIAADDEEHPLVQQDAVNALVEINAGGSVAPGWRRVKLHQTLARLDHLAADPGQPGERRAAARDAATTARSQPDAGEALRQAKQAVANLEAATMKPVVVPDPAVEARRVVAGLVGLLRREYGWWDRFDPAVFARHASAEQWQSVDAYTEAAAGFLHEARTARK